MVMELCTRFRRRESRNAKPVRYRRPMGVSKCVYGVGRFKKHKRRFSALKTKFLNVSHKSKHATLGRWYSTARVSKRPSHMSAACLRARYCTNLTCSDLTNAKKLSLQSIQSEYDYQRSPSPSTPPQPPYSPGKRGFAAGLILRS